jgi:hypothetical protein
MKPFFACIAFLLTTGCSFGQDTTKTYVINFPTNKTGLTKEIKTTLDSIARTMKAWSMNCTIRSCNYGENEKRLLAGWRRMSNMTTYLVKKQAMPPHHVNTSTNTSCTGDGFEISFTRENNNTPAPAHPNIKAL